MSASVFTTVGQMISETYAELVPFRPDRSRRTLERRYTNEASSFLHLDDARVHYRDEGATRQHCSVCTEQPRRCTPGNGSTDSTGSTGWFGSTCRGSG
jgi:hypothetical protein